MKLLISALSICIIFTLGCAEMQKDWQNNNCNYDGAYAQGTNDSKNGSNMNPSALTSQCPPETNADVQRGYREGFTSQANSISSVLDKVISVGKSKSCKAKQNEVHSGFCANHDESVCRTHSGVCAWK